MTSTRDALVDAVLAAPGDLAPRLVLGDWLCEHGDPWGELILLQCTRPEAPRIRELLADTSWLGPLYSPRLRWVFREGLPIAFELDGAFRYEWEDAEQVAAYVYVIEFRGDNRCKEAFWELTEQAPSTARQGRYELSPWEALRGHGAIGVRMTYPPPPRPHSPYAAFNGEESHGVLRGEQLFVRGKNVFQLMHVGPP